MPRIIAEINSSYIRACAYKLNSGKFESVLSATVYLPNLDLLTPSIKIQVSIIT